jgi:hypothetical protein
MDTEKQINVLRHILATAQGLLRYTCQAEETEAVEWLTCHLNDVIDACKDGIEEAEAEEEQDRP